MTTTLVPAFILQYMKIRLSILCLFLIPGAMFADTACLSGSVATLLLQGPCTIGDKIFNFTSYAPYTYSENGGITGGANDAGSVFFTPLSDDLNAPGFRLTGSFYAEASAGPNSFAYAETGGSLFFSVATIDNQATIYDGFFVTGSLASLTATVDPACQPNDCVANPAGLADGILNGSARHYVDQLRQTSGQSPFRSTGSFSTGSLEEPIAAATGNVFFSAAASSTNRRPSGSAYSSSTFTSADFLVRQIAPVPEPSYAVVSGLALLGFWVARRRIYRQP